MRAATGTYDNDSNTESGVIFDIIRAAQSQKRTYLLEHESKAILEDCDIRTTGAVLCTSPDEAQAAAANIGYPVVLKVVSPTVIHKSDCGGVVLDLNNEDAVRQAYQNIATAFSNRGMTGVAVQKMVPAGIEVIVGFTRDESFGPVLMFGLGGIFAEVLKDVTFRVLPITRDMAADMISEIKGYPILTGARGNPVDVEALKDLLVKISDLAMECTSIRELDINPLVLYPSGYIAVDARIFVDIAPRESTGYTQGTENLVQLFYPRSIAILGATDTPGKLGYNVIYNLLAHYFQGKLYPVNPKKDKILGLKTYRSIQDIDAEIDAAIIIVPAQAVSRAIEECCRKGIRYLIVESAGFAETGEAGKNIQTRIKELVVANNCRVLGPNCSGIINTHHNMVQSIGIIDELGKGNIGLIAQAGVYAAGMLTGLRKVLDFGIIATIGNKMDITETDILEFMGQDDHIDVIALYMEDVTNGRQFIDAARRISMKKPIIALKTGRTEEGKKAVSSH
ncbi:MAG: acetate--CoA ligase family protein, partial [Syntrophorhabdaceae bacterium]